MRSPQRKRAARGAGAALCRLAGVLLLAGGAAVPAEHLVAEVSAPKERVAHPERSQRGQALPSARAAAATNAPSLWARLWRRNAHDRPRLARQLGL